MQREITLRGNELGWILKLAEGHYDSKEFREWIKNNKLEKLNKLLSLLIAKFHPNNFNAGSSKTIWLLREEPTPDKQLESLHQELRDLIIRGFQMKHHLANCEVKTLLKEIPELN